MYSSERKTQRKNNNNRAGKNQSVGKSRPDSGDEDYSTLRVFSKDNKLAGRDGRKMLIDLVKALDGQQLVEGPVAESVAILPRSADGKVRGLIYCAGPAEGKKLILRLKERKKRRRNGVYPKFVGFFIEASNTLYGNWSSIYDKRPGWQAETRRARQKAGPTSASQQPTTRVAAAASTTARVASTVRDSQIGTGFGRATPDRRRRATTAAHPPSAPAPRATAAAASYSQIEGRSRNSAFSVVAPRSRASNQPGGVVEMQFFNHGDMPASPPAGYSIRPPNFKAIGTTSNLCSEAIPPADIPSRNLGDLGRYAALATRVTHLEGLVSAEEPPMMRISKSDLAARIANLEQKYDEVLDDTGSVNSYKEGLVARIEMLEKNQIVMDDAEERVHKRDELIREMEEEIESQELKIEQLAKENAQLRLELESGAAAAKLANEKLEGARRELEERKAEVETLEAALARNTANVVKLTEGSEKALKAQKAEVDQLNSSLTEAREENARLVRSLADAKEELEALHLRAESTANNNNVAPDLPRLTNETSNKTESGSNPPHDEDHHRLELLDGAMAMSEYAPSEAESSCSGMFSAESSPRCADDSVISKRGQEHLLSKQRPEIFVAEDANPKKDGENPHTLEEMVVEDGDLNMDEPGMLSRKSVFKSPPKKGTTISTSKMSAMSGAKRRRSQKNLLKSPEVPEEAPLDKTVSWDDLDLKNELYRGIVNFGWEYPSRIQALALAPILKGGDVIAQAQSGQGKTGCFVISSLQAVDENDPRTQVLILSPTRELAQQSHDLVMKPMSQYMTKMKTCCLIGGASFGKQKQQLLEGAHVVCGTPGRVWAMIDQGYLRTDGMKLFVLDEADEMLQKGFKDQVKEIYTTMPPGKRLQICLFSATLPPEVVELADTFMVDATKILMRTDELSLEGLKQFFFLVDQSEYKYDALMHLYENLSIDQCVIFVNHTDRAERLAEMLNQYQFTCSVLNGRMKQQERKAILDRFRLGESRVLVTTDLLARGFDATVKLVVNYDLPQSKETYLHRIGRSARFGRKGVSINLVTRDDLNWMKKIEDHYSTKIVEFDEDFVKEMF